MQVMFGKNETLNASHQFLPLYLPRSDLLTPFGDCNTHLAPAQ
jgi:hypothetical protein